jgi:DNA-binding IclR family transcriptional regulator
MSDATLTTVRNAARLLKEFLSREDELGVSELARRLGLGKSAVHRLLTTLQSEGLVQQGPRTDGYRLGIVMFELGEAARVHMDLHVAAHSTLARLREQTGETSQVSVADGDDVVVVDRMESAHSLRLFTEAGRRVPMYCTASGKVMLAFRTAQHRAAYLSRVELRPLTAHTITDPARLRVELRSVRARGWAESMNERELGVASVAAPVRDVSGAVVAAISVGAPITRYRGVPRKRMTQAVVQAGEEVSRRLGWPAENGRRVID